MMFIVGTKFRSFLLAGGAAICWPIWQTRNVVVFDNVDTKLFYRFFLGEHIGFISRPSCSGVRHWKVGGRGLLQAGECNNVFLHVLGMAFYLQNCVLSRFCFVSWFLSSWSDFCNKVIWFLFFHNEARCSFHYPISKWQNTQRKWIFSMHYCKTQNLALFVLS